MDAAARGPLTRPVLVSADRLLTDAESPMIDGGAVLVEDGPITAVGRRTGLAYTAYLSDPYFCPWDERDALLVNLRGRSARRAAAANIHRTLTVGSGRHG